MTREKAKELALKTSRALKCVGAENYVNDIGGAFLLEFFDERGHMIFEYVTNKTNQIVQDATKIAEREVRAPKCVRDFMETDRRETLRKFISRQEDLMKAKGIKFERITGKQSGNLLGWYLNCEDLEKPLLFCESVKKTINENIVESTDKPKIFEHKPVVKMEINDPPRTVKMVNSDTGEETVFRGNKTYVAGIDDYELYDDPSKIGGFWIGKMEDELLEELRKITESVGVMPLKTVSRNTDISSKEIKQKVDDFKNFKLSTKGQKLDDSKLPLAIVIQRQFPLALQAVAECSKYGHDKYRDLGDEDYCNLHRVENGLERYSNAMMRHFLAAGKDLDKKDSETNLEHLKHMTWNALCLLEVYEQQKQNK